MKVKCFCPFYDYESDDTEPIEADSPKDAAIKFAEFVDTERELFHFIDNDKQRYPIEIDTLAEPDGVLRTFIVYMKVEYAAKEKSNG